MRWLLYGYPCMELLILIHVLSKPWYPPQLFVVFFFLLSSVIYDIYLCMHNLPACVLDSPIANMRMSLRLPKG